TEMGLAVLAPCRGYGNLVNDLSESRRILDFTRISVERGIDPVKTYDPETIGLTFVRPQDLLAIFVEDQRATMILSLVGKRTGNKPCEYSTGCRIHCGVVEIGSNWLLFTNWTGAAP